MLLNTILLVTVFGLFLLLIDLYYDRIEKEVREAKALKYLINLGREDVKQGRTISSAKFKERLNKRKLTCKSEIIPPIDNVNDLENWLNSDKYNKMCNCKNVDMGSHSNEVILGYYPVMRKYADNRRLAGLSPYGICVDRCIVNQVIELWIHGVRTYGSCCGHNKVQGMINVGEDYEKALAVGFEPYVFKNEPDRKDTVKTKRITINEI